MKTSYLPRNSRLHAWMLSALLACTGLIQSVHAAVHPGVLHTQADIDRMISKVNVGAQPWKGSWDRLTSNWLAQSTYTPNPQQYPCAGGGGCPNGESFLPMAKDCAAAYQNALRYRISGDTAHANKARDIMNAWEDAMWNGGWTGDSNVALRAGLYGFQWAAAAELMRGYSGWAAKDFNDFKNLLLTKFYPINSDFLVRHNNRCFDHYWANWDVANMSAIIGIGVLCDHQAKIDEAVNYFKFGVGTGRYNRLCNFVHAGSPQLGQCQESGRDQGHATLVMALAGQFLQTAYIQGHDLFAYDDNRMLKMFEYTAKYNLNQSVPWSNYTLCNGWGMTAVSASARGTVRPCWELVYNHYVKVKGLTADFSAQWAANLRPEGGGGHYGNTSGGFDQLGFGTLTHTLDSGANTFPAAGTYNVQCRTNGMVLDSWGRSANGSNCALSADNGHVNQNWRLTYISSNVVKLQAVGGGLFLDGMGHTTNGSVCGLYADGSSNNQRWMIIDAGGGYYKLRNLGTGLCADIGGSPWVNGDNLEQWPEGGSTNLQWRFIAP